MCKYGFKQAYRQWYIRIDTFMSGNGYKRYHYDHCCYLKKFSDFHIIFFLYVNDMLITSLSMAEITRLKE